MRPPVWRMGWLNPWSPSTACVAWTLTQVVPSGSSMYRLDIGPRTNHQGHEVSLSPLVALLLVIAISMKLKGTEKQIVFRCWEAWPCFCQVLFLPLQMLTLHAREGPSGSNSACIQPYVRNHTYPSSHWLALIPVANLMLTFLGFDGI